MQIVCPQCKSRFSFDETRIESSGVKLRCGKCKAVFKVVRKPGDTRVSAETPSATEVTKPKLFVANESPAFCSAVQKVLAGEPVEVISFNDGLETMRAIECQKPAVVLLDVALPSMYGFEICESVRHNPDLDNVKLILVASIYDKTKYKRTPSSLYGADAYIEKHHIPDSLAPLVKKLIRGENEDRQISEEQVETVASITAAAEADDLGVPAGDESARDEIRRDEELATTVPSSSAAHMPLEEFSEATVKARRLARIIVSDILLYNQEKVLEGIKSGSFYELLREEIKEGKALYARRVSPEVANGTAFLDDAFEQLISVKRNELGL
ncbi:putative transcriptional regulator ycf27 [Geobacter sp. OR-1]|uniref:zinc-ribbon domain-containing protein n=1 Tax=Geobacter sp. OR-1 TaxID=1266765 RepID=UPI000542993B|nr:zinc-ribbon domain-containing protein [Geobacter sp. OR-1]GAM08187.1 putative transcriptional regulator ycf27 [Geobacter sp. OR-1]